MGGIIASFFISQLPQVLGGLVSKAWPELAGIFGKLNDGQISVAEAQESTKRVLAEQSASVDKAALEASAASYTAFMGALQRSKILQWGWIITLLDQLAVLTWYQWVVPIGDLQGWWINYPSPGATVEWSYFIVAACIGAGPLVFPKRTK